MKINENSWHEKEEGPCFEDGMSGMSGHVRTCGHNVPSPSCGAYVMLTHRGLLLSSSKFCNGNVLSLSIENPDTSYQK